MDEESKSEILQVVEGGKSVYFLRIDYAEGDIGSAIGHVFETDGRRDAGSLPPQVLATNEPLRTLWISKANHLWVGSADGTVGTTAPVQWPSPMRGADYLTLGSSPKWSATDLPPIRATRLAPNVTALWGMSDEDVYVGAYGGHVFHWDGKQWAQVFEGPGSGNGTIRAFGGTGPQDVFAVGQDQTILHFDGSAWRKLQAPGAPDNSEGFTSVVAAGKGKVFISASGQEPRLLHGAAASLGEFGRYPIQLIDMAALNDRVLFATGDGVAELIGRDVKMIKSTFMTATVSAGRGRLFFIEPAQTVPSYIEYDPRDKEAPWWRITF